MGPEEDDKIEANRLPYDGSLSAEVCSDAQKLAREINDDPMGGEDEIAAAIQNGFDVHRSRVVGEIVAWLRSQATEEISASSVKRLAYAVERRFGGGESGWLPIESAPIGEINFLMINQLVRAGLAAKASLRKYGMGQGERRRVGYWLTPAGRAALKEGE